MKKDPLSPSQETNKVKDNSSPAKPPSNPMMLNWLNKANAKKQSETENKNKSTINKNETKTSSIIKSPVKKEETTNKKETTKSATATTKTSPKTKKISPKATSETSTKKASTATKTKSAKHLIEDDDDEDDFEIISEKKSKTSSSKSNKEKASVASDKDDKTKTTPGKKGGSKFYAAYMRREGPKNPGSKRIPIGKKDCFAGLKFLVTGVMDSLDRQECQRIIEKYGGSCISGVTKKLDYLIVGQDAGQSKLNKADELNVKQISEDQFLELICQKSGITNPKYEDDGDEQMQMDVDEEIKYESKEEEEIAAKPSTKIAKKPNLKLLDESDEDEKPSNKKTTPKKLNG
jgi:replication factor C subunit 1